MEAKAQARYVRVTPMKARRVVDLIRGKRAGEAVAVLSFAPQAASEPVRKVVQSAIANARQAAQRTSVAFDERDLVVQAAYVDEGPTMKRFRPRAQGRAYRIKKRTSHITVVVGDEGTTASRPAPAAKAAEPAAKKAPAKKAAAKKAPATKAAASAAPTAAGTEKAATKAAAKKATAKKSAATEEGTR